MTVAFWLAASLAVQAVRIASIGTLALGGFVVVLWIAAGG
jgi:hypothetical protein